MMTWRDMSLCAFLKHVGSKEVLATIRAEARQDAGTKKAGSSSTLLDMIHEFDDSHKDALKCNRSARGCLILLIKSYVTKRNYKEVAQLVEPVIRALTDYNPDSPDMIQQMFTKVNNAYAEKFKPDSEEHKYVRSVLVLNPEERILRTSKASAVRVEHNKHQVSEEEVLLLTFCCLKPCVLLHKMRNWTTLTVATCSLGWRWLLDQD